MKMNLKSRKLKILVFLAGVAYVLMFINTCIEAWDYGKQGIIDGWNKGKNDTSFGYLTFNVQQSGPVKISPDSLINKIDNNKIPVCSQTLEVRAPFGLTKLSRWLFYFKLLIGPFVAVAIILVPVYFFKILKLIERNSYFEDKLIRFLRRMAFALIVIYFGYCFDSFIFYLIKKQSFQFSDYKISVPLVDNLWLLLGILAYIIAELLTIAKVLKEEQELTI